MDKADYLFSKNYKLLFNFNEHSTQRNNITGYLTDKLCELFRHHKAKGTIKFLDVGCGDGHKTLAVIRKLRKFADVKSTVLDPSKELLDYFKKHSSEKDIEYILDKWETYEPKDTYDLIISIHTFYYVTDWERSIRKMKEFLKKDGIICICIRSKGDVYKFKDHFLPKLNDEYKSERNFIELRETLDKMGLEYAGDLVESELDINDILSDNEKGRMLLEFMLRKPYEDITPDVRKEIAKYIAASNVNGKLMHKDGCVWIKKQ